MTIRQWDNHGIRALLVAMGLLMYGVMQVAASTHDVDLPPGDNFAVASFRAWLPEGVKTIKAVVVLVPGYNGDGRDWVNDPVWQSLARRHDSALLACYFANGSTFTATYCMANKGSGAALVNAVNAVAEKSGHPEIKNAPLALWGHSAGGQFNYEFACWKPERVIAFIVNKGGYYHTEDTSAKTRSTPALFFIGAKDEDFRVRNITGFFQRGRSQGALWALAVEPDAGHEQGKTPGMAVSFFDAIIPLRLKAGGGLAEIAESSGWVGDLVTFDTCPAGSGAEHPGAWLPDKPTATCWQTFVGKVVKASN